MKTAATRLITCSLAISAIVLQVQADTHYVDLAGSHAVPFTNWLTAATNIQDAVNAAANGDTVLVTNGTYMLIPEVVVTNDITIESVNGPAFTIVDGGGSNRCFSLEYSISTISGFTITNGYTSGHGGGVFCQSVFPIVTNCIITGNTALTDGGGLYSARASHCTISGNTAGRFGGGLDYGEASFCMISGNMAKYGGGAAGAPLNHCTVSGNSATDWAGGAANGAPGGIIITNNSCLIISNITYGVGGGMWAGTAINCTVSGNTATNGGGLYNVKADNCIVWYNTASSNSDIRSFLIDDIKHTCSPDALHSSAGNITNAPLFIDKNNGDYRLPQDSPCVDNGNNPAVVVTTDLVGNPRILDAVVDMGAYEFVPGLDTDLDGLSDYVETNRYGTNPLIKDSDEDGFADGIEVEYMMPPLIDNSGLLGHIGSNSPLYGLYTSNSVLDLALGDIGVEITNGNAELTLEMWQSDDLATWTNAGGNVEWSLPVDTHRKFFRVRVEP